jgi:hypothetical protein
MSSLGSRPLLLLLVALLVIRFAVMPWMNWAEETRGELEVLTQRLDRSVGVVANSDAIRASSKRLAVRSAALQPLFRDATGAEDFKLATQQEVTGWFADSGARLEVFDWLVTEEEKTSDSVLLRTRARVQLAGGLRALAVLQGKLEASMPAAVVREARVRVIGSADNPSELAASMTLVIDFYGLSRQIDARD